MNGLASIFFAEPRCSFCGKSEGHERWCQVSPEWIAMEAVFSVADTLSMPATIEQIHELAKKESDTGALTLQATKEIVESWVELGEFELTNGKYWKVKGGLFDKA